MNAKKVLILSLLVAGTVIITGMVTVALRNKAGHIAESERSGQPGVTLAPVIREEPTAPLKIPAAETQPQVQTAKADVSPVGKIQPVAIQAVHPAKRKKPIQDPAARVALSLVGADADAEEYWFAAINDPTLSAHERKDLIEDLNEDGLSDPKRPGPRDLPLIPSRIELIETLAPFAMDQVNANAFAEAYKDLVNLADGQPVR